jgi:hypothetical protein
MIEPPVNPSESNFVDCRIYTCRQGQGLWVCRHNTETHVDDFANIRNQRQRIECNLTQTSYSNRGNSDHPFPPTSKSGFLPPMAHFSLVGYLDNYLPEDESNKGPTDEEQTP